MQEHYIGLSLHVDCCGKVSKVGLQIMTVRGVTLKPSTAVTLRMKTTMNEKIESQTEIMM